MKLINQWSICPNPRNPYTAPELRQPCLQGLCEGRYIITSPLMEGRLMEGKLVLRTQNSDYILGEVDAEYEQQFPEAIARVRKIWMTKNPYCNDFEDIAHDY